LTFRLTNRLEEGYDLALLGNLYASPVFNEKYGHWNEENKKYQVSAAWQSVAGWITDRYGSKKTTIVFLVMMIGTIFALFFAPNIQVLVAGEVLCGKVFW
jgi:SP family general alpha glucoside:H+ symporter-like MFS transporter